MTYKQTIQRPFAYEKDKTYWVAGARTAWDTVPIGLYESRDTLVNDWDGMDVSKFARHATQKEIIDFFGLVKVTETEIPKQ